MPFDSSGTFNRDRSWVTEATAGTKIRADNHDTHDGDLATGLSNCLTKTGVTQPTANIPMNSHRLINLAQPINAQDAATKNYVDNFRIFPTSITISGANANGQIIFSSPTGSNGLSWDDAGVDMSFVGRVAKTGEGSKRLVINNKMDASTNLGGDVVRFDERGMVGNNGELSSNLSTTDGTTWRTISAGYGALLDFKGGDFKLRSNDVASITNPYVAVTLREFFNAKNEQGSSVVNLIKSASGKSASIRGLMGASELRWIMYLGDTLAESGTARIGSNFQIVSYDNQGANGISEMKIDRSTHTVTFPGPLTTGGQLNVDSIVQSTDAVLILASQPNGAIYFHPNGAGSAIERSYINNTGDFFISNDLSIGIADPKSYGAFLGAGRRGKGAGTSPNSGSSGSYDAYWHNQNWNGSDIRMFVNTTSVGLVDMQTCDYRIKKDINPLPSTWEAIKQLKPISYTQKGYEVWVGDDQLRWGFLAHELQDALGPQAAEGIKDGPEIQQLNSRALLAALTKALQEAIARIEALEAA